jgi:glutamate N-acetyltransferase/amino-acid N-acetyltransferase
VSVTHAKGFIASGVEAGLKHSGGKDLALVQNLGPRDAAAVVFTSNRAKANPIIWSQQVIADGRVSAIVLNSGGANCYTGAAGFQVTHATAEAPPRALDDGALGLAVRGHDGQRCVDAAVVTQLGLGKARGDDLER